MTPIDYFLIIFSTILPENGSGLRPGIVTSKDTRWEQQKRKGNLRENPAMRGRNIGENYEVMCENGKEARSWNINNDEIQNQRTFLITVCNTKKVQRTIVGIHVSASCTSRLKLFCQPSIILLWTWGKYPKSAEYNPRIWSISKNDQR